MLDSTVSTSTTADQMRADAKALIAKANTFEVQALLDSGTRFWDIPNYASDAEAGILIEQHETGRFVQYRVRPIADYNTLGAEWDSNNREPKKNRIYPPEFAFKSIAVVRLVSTLTDDAGNELRRYADAE